MRQRLVLTLGLLLSLGVVFVAHGDTVYPLALRAVTRPPLPWPPAALLAAGSACLIASDVLRPKAARTGVGLAGLAALWTGWVLLAGTSELFWLVLATSVPFAVLSLTRLLRLLGPDPPTPPPLPPDPTREQRA